MDGRLTAGLPMRACTALLLLLPFVFACTPHVEPDDLLGTWQAHDGANGEKLVLRPDATFVHSMVIDGKRLTASGEWKLLRANRAPGLLLKYDRDFQLHRSTGSRNVVQSWRGELALSADEHRESRLVKTISFH